ncbi:polyketide cyclase [Lysobacter sp. A289]
MTRLIEFLISLAIVAVAFLVIGFFLPSTRHIQQSVETNRKITIVYDTLNSFARFDDWNVLPLRDPEMDIKLTGPDSGIGAQLDYSSDAKGVGDGSWKLVDSQPRKSVSFEVVNNEPGSNKRTSYILEPTGRSNRNVKITQIYDVDYGMNLFGRYAGMYVTSGMGDRMKMSLNRFSNMLAAVPNYDYAELSKDNPEMAPKVIERPAVNMLIVGAAVERNNDVVQRTMKNNMQWIEKVMKANDLEPAGPVRIITNEFGAETYAFDVAQPVRKAGSGADKKPAADETDGDESEDDAGADAADIAAANAAPGPAVKLDIKLEGPVTHVFEAPAKVAMVPFVGHMANMPKVRDALRAWVMTRGDETAGRPYEAWINGIDKGFTEEGDFEVYWTLR